jgi:hypothetical protein
MYTNILKLIQYSLLERSAVLTGLIYVLPVTRLIAREDYIESCRRESFKTYILKLVYMHNDLLHVSAKHMAIFREPKYKG